MQLEKAIKLIRSFEAGSLTNKLSKLESDFLGLDKISAEKLCKTNNLDSKLLTASFEIKEIAPQVNVVIHAAGILTALPAILEKGEKVEYLSLGAGNTGKAFDLETNHRVAEFKFIHWKGGAESI